MRLNSRWVYATSYAFSTWKSNRQLKLNCHRPKTWLFFLQSNLFISHLPHLNNSQLHPSRLQAKNLGVISDYSLSPIHGNRSHQQILSLYLLNRAKIQPCLTTPTITILIQAIISSSWIVTIIGLPASTSSCPTVCSQHSSQSGLFKTALRSLHASTQHPPVPSHLMRGKKTGFTKTYKVQPLPGSCLILFTHLLKCSPSLTRLQQLASLLTLNFLLFYLLLNLSGKFFNQTSTWRISHSQPSA